jgi:RimJ/RimL family protein N-acetyltransferase
MIVVREDHLGRGLSGACIRAMAEVVAARGAADLVAPVRPTLKHRYPLIPMERYADWRRPDGAPFDPWLRAHERAGGKRLGVAPAAMTVVGTVAEWETWTEMAFPSSGEFVVPGGLVPVDIDVERDEGRYEEPGCWMRHRCPPRKAAIAELQRNRNPLIHRPAWADRIAFAGSDLAAPPISDATVRDTGQRALDRAPTASVEPDLIVVGERVALGPLQRELAPTYARWINALDTRLPMLRVGIATPETEATWVEETAAAAAGLEPTVVAFTLYDRRDLAPVGTAMLFRVSHVHRSAVFGIALGERRGEGLGTEATRLMLDWAFNVVGLAYVSLETLPSNPAAIRAYERAGFRRIGRRRSAVVSGGRRHDVVLMEALSDEFRDSILARPRD